MKLVLILGILVVNSLYLKGQQPYFAQTKSSEFALMIQEKLNLTEEKMCTIQLIVEDIMSEGLKENTNKRFNGRRFMRELEPVFIPKIKAVLTEAENSAFDSILFKIEEQRLKVQNRRKEILMKKGGKKKKKDSISQQ